MRSGGDIYTFQYVTLPQQTRRGASCCSFALLFAATFERARETTDNSTSSTGLGAHFKCPVVVLTTEQQNGAISSLVGNPSSQSSVPNAWLGNVASMDLKHRAKNFFLTIAERIMMTYSHGKDSKFYRWNFPLIKEYPKLDYQLRNVSLVLVNDHFSLTVPRPNLPAVVPVASMHIKQRPALPEVIILKMLVELK